MSTVFEPECWTLSPRNLLNGKDCDAGYLGKVDEPDFLNQHLLNNEEIENELTSREVITTDTQTDDYFMTSDLDSDRKYLLSLLPRTVYFPTEPLKLSKDDELKLIRVLNKEMQGVHQNQLREVYTVLSTIDRKLTGWCSFQHLSFAFTKKNVSYFKKFFILILLVQFFGRTFLGNCKSLILIGCCDGQLSLNISGLAAFFFFFFVISSEQQPT